MKKPIKSLTLGTKFKFYDADCDLCVYVVGNERNDGRFECKSILVHNGKEWKESSHSTKWLEPSQEVEVVKIRIQKIEVASIEDAFLEKGFN